MIAITIATTCRQCGRTFTPAPEDIKEGTWRLCPPCRDGPNRTGQTTRLVPSRRKDECGQLRRLKRKGEGDAHGSAIGLSAGVPRVAAATASSRHDRDASCKAPLFTLCLVDMPADLRDRRWRFSDSGSAPLCGSRRHYSFAAK